jgi:hypothetical protein
MTDQPAVDPIVVQVEDEHVHDHGADADPLWSESHYMDAVSPDGESGVYVRHGRLPVQGRSHIMLAIVRQGAGPVLIGDGDAPLPAVRGADLLVTAGDYDVGLELESPVRRMRVTARGTATAYDEPAGPLHQAPGRKVPFELDLTWTTDGVPYRWRATTRYELPCRVTGQVVADGERTAIDWVGQRDHSWGPRDWWAFQWCWMAVHLDDGSRWHSAAITAVPGTGMGCFSRDGQVTEIASITASATHTARGLFGDTTEEVQPGGHRLVLSPVSFAPVRMEAADGRVSFFSRATCRVTASDGRHGVGWMEWNIPQGGPAAPTGVA